MTNQEDLYTKAYAKWLVARGELFDALTKEGNPPKKITDNHFDSYNALISEPVTRTIDVEQKLRAILTEDAGDMLDPSHVTALNYLIRDLASLR